MRKALLLGLFSLSSLFGADEIADVSVGIQVGNDYEGYPDDIWYGPGWYYGLWFGNEADYWAWRGRYPGWWRHHQRWHRHGGHWHGGHHSYGHGGGHH